MLQIALVTFEFHLSFLVKTPLTYIKGFILLKSLFLEGNYILWDIKFLFSASIKINEYIGETKQSYDSMRSLPSNLLLIQLLLLQRIVCRTRRRGLPVDATKVVRARCIEDVDT